MQGLQGMHLIQADMNPVYDASSGDDGQVYEMDPGGIDQINRWIETHQAAMFRFSIHTRSILTNEVCFPAAFSGWGFGFRLYRFGFRL